MLFKIISTCKGGGYMYCRTIPIHPKANSKGLYPLHRVLMENKLNRLLKKNEDVHHKNENKNDNYIGNLEVLTKSEHSKIHNKVVPLIKCTCSNCNKIFELKPHLYRLRIKRAKNNKFCCSRSCSARYQNKNVL